MASSILLLYQVAMRVVIHKEKHFIFTKLIKNPSLFRKEKEREKKSKKEKVEEEIEEENFVILKWFKRNQK